MPWILFWFWVYKWAVVYAAIELWKRSQVQPSGYEAALQSEVMDTELLSQSFSLNIFKLSIIEKPL